MRTDGADGGECRRGERNRDRLREKEREVERETERARVKETLKYSTAEEFFKTQIRIKFTSGLCDASVML